METTVLGQEEKIKKTGVQKYIDIGNKRICQCGLTTMVRAIQF